MSKKICWSETERLCVWLLSATSIACLLSDFYGICPMRRFTLWIFGPALLALAVWTWIDSRGPRRILRPMLIGSAGGLLAAIAYDLYRLPYVFSQAWGLSSMVPPLNLFKVFPAFGAMILGQPYPQESYSLAAHLVGWVYHFTNGLTFGLMYMAMVGDPSKRHWAWAVVMALVIELGMLFTPYTRAFGIPMGQQFLFATATAHLIFGIVLGLTSRKMWRIENAPSFAPA